MPIPTSTTAPAGTPACCPACRSHDLQAPSKTSDSSTYWRCRTCGEVWNVTRREQGSRQGFPRR